MVSPSPPTSFLKIAGRCNRLHGWPHKPEVVSSTLTPATNFLSSTVIKSQRFLPLAFFFLLFINCNDFTCYDKEINAPNKQEYIVWGYVTVDSVLQIHKTVHLWIEDSTYPVSDCIFECESNYKGIYQFNINYIPWNGHKFRLFIEHTFYDGYIKFGETEQINIYQ